MALVLLVSAVLMIRTFAALRNVDPGFSDPAHLETMRIWVPGFAGGRSSHGGAHAERSLRTSWRRFPGVDFGGLRGCRTDGRDRSQLG
jgi:hypothetical protein